ncbi:23S rRNA (guanosine(2251)-2'-O)-methyltransferase RlmB [methane-oxidizing endosymbiont of Gigantopelta aegis]|uniref:23S rRNA (guanosine(2251)-2'-O)-methyltransferase RlmB n=1 Tax=methane-oxidizing endosymbiont of Gigantopelta aegis TaxID=2794938 RepID=UPI0018DB3EC3|nr:23S rRNA (guanosine(2251)-2'-O)-methyltransferase RlmB [methane-oxidizing endosymbiont of Gigantopelta aegis]
MSQAKVFGIHAAQAALDYSADKIKRAWVDHQRQDKRLMPLLEALNKYQIPVVKADRKKLDGLAEGKNHQGIILDIQLPGVRTEADLKSAVQSLDTPAFFLVLDQVQDPHNLGACLRTADAVGADGIIIPKDNSVGITSTVCKVASGAAETVPVYQVVNLARTLRWLKQQQIWIFGSSGDSEQSVFAADLTLPLALIMGTEGTGMRQLTARQCDFRVKIPMQGTVESLNVSVAAGIMMYEVRRQRGM